MGLLARLRDVHDERRVRIYLDRCGAQTQARAAKIPDCVLSATQCSVSELVALTQQRKAFLPAPDGLTLSTTQPQKGNHRDQAKTSTTAKAHTQVAAMAPPKAATAAWT